MRRQYTQKLEELKIELFKMGSTCEESMNIIAKVIDNSELLDEDFNRIKELENISDIQEKQLESMCLKLIFTQQPVATDLRLISAVLKMISDLERICDQAVDITELIKESNLMITYHNENLNKMIDALVLMVKNSVESLIKGDTDLALKVLENDSLIDTLFDDIKNDVIKEIDKDRNVAISLVDILMIAKYFERIGDHSTNIAEWVIFIYGN